jgi:hypothetical protein
VTQLRAGWTFWLLTLVAAASYGGEPVQLPDGTTIEQVDFERHITGLLGRLGCNAGTCHGSFQGKGGFRLSLFGQSPAKDFAAIAARINPSDPSDSLLLKKALNLEEHDGGKRLLEGSWEHRLLEQWISASSKHVVGRGQVTQLVFEPAGSPVLKPEESLGVRVTAQFSDEAREIVTALCTFRVQDETIAKVDALGKVTASKSGATSLIASYRGMFASLPIIVPYPNSGVAPASVATNFVDEEVSGRLGQLQLDISAPASDADFLRRVSLDVIGTLPSAHEVREFLSDEHPGKRLRKIDQLLAHPARAALWATRMCDITACNVDTMEQPPELRPKRAKMWHDWFRRRFAANVPYDEIVRGVLGATSREDKPIDEWIDNQIALQRGAESSFESGYAERPTLDLFWRRINADGPVPVEDLAELTATAFLGVRLHCARCHQHPFDHWSQQDFASYAGIFGRVQFGSSTALRTKINERLDARRAARKQGQTLPELPRIQEVFLTEAPRPLIDAYSSSPVAPKALGGPALSEDGDPRHALLGWLRKSPDSQLAKSFVNRVWAKYFGRALVEPVDAFSAANPATHPQLLSRLAEEFVSSGYDVIHLERLILSSNAYQRSATPVGNNAADERNFAHAAVRPLLAEVLVDAINTALETHEDFGSDAPPGTRAIEVPVNRFANARLNEMFQVLGRGDRKSLCDCDRSADPSVRQSVLLMSDVTLLQKIKEGRLSRLLAEGADNVAMVDELYLSTLSRQSNDFEREYVLSHIARHDRGQALTDVLWALINTGEFRTNH